ncbi:MAG: M23 family metallopeptidase [Angelakisella sp.]|nr:M23 family metallopeptidase [Angelakisella sp.]
MDIAAKAATPVLAARGGTVVHADEHSVWPYDKRIDIDHGDGWITRYAQLNSINVAEGDKVVQGQQIGGVGRTGNATGNHLHFKIRYQGGSLDPANYIGTKAPEQRPPKGLQTQTPKKPQRKQLPLGLLLLVLRFIGLGVVPQ